MVKSNSMLILSPLEFTSAKRVEFYTKNERYKVVMNCDDEFVVEGDSCSCAQMNNFGSPCPHIIAVENSIFVGGRCPNCSSCNIVDSKSEKKYICADCGDYREEVDEIAYQKGNKRILKGVK